MDNGNRILSVKGLHITFDGQPFSTVKDLSFTLDKGETLAIVGESGSGKSLTALALAGLLPRNARASGEAMFLAGDQRVNLAQTSPNTAGRIRGKDIAMVFQEPMSALNPIMKVGTQLQEAILAHNDISNKEARQLAIDWLSKVQLPTPADMYERYPHQLSGGQKQRVMIAMAMCNHPTLLIADEPTTALDVTVQQEIIYLMQYLQQEHATAMLFITHDLALASSIADKILVMYNGEIMEYGDASQVLSMPRSSYTKALLACRPSPEHKGSILPTVPEMLAGNFSGIATPQSPVKTPEKHIMEINDLEVWFTTSHAGSTLYHKAVNGISFVVNAGEVLGLVGESGCGKSTVARALTGLVPVKSGNILYGETDLAMQSPKEWKPFRTKIQMVFQDPYSSLNPRMTIGDAIAEPLLIHGIVPAHEVNKEVERLLEMVQLPESSKHKYPHQFSGGQRQRAGIARALSVRPQLLICDESVSALDVSVQAQILNLLKSLQEQLGLTLLFISHDLNVVHYISDRVMVMKAGKIVESGDAVQVLRHPANEYTRKLVSAMPQQSPGS